ncbi:MAG: flagellar hook-basal body complex protein FliE [Thalassotalea sp.]
MDIKGNSLYAQMQGMALQANNMMPSRAVGDISNDNLSIKPVNTSSNDFGDLLKDALGAVNDLQKDTGAKRKAFELGDESVTLADTMIASSKSGIAFDATVQIRNKFVEAYKEIMSMPV